MNISYKNIKIFVFVTTCICVITRISMILPVDLVDGGGDSTGRIQSILSHFPGGTDWFVEPYRLPLYFFTFSLPLHIHYSVEALFIFQNLLAGTLSLMIFFTVKEHFDQEIAVLSFLLSLCMPLIFDFSNSALPELLSANMILVSIHFAQIYLETKEPKKLIGSMTTLLLSSFIHYPSWILFSYLWLIIFFKLPDYKILISSLFIFFLLIGIRELKMLSLGYDLFMIIKDNYYDASKVNTDLELISGLSRFEKIFSINWRNIGVLTLFIPLGIISLRRDLYHLVWLFFFVLLTLGCFTNNIAFFERHWFISCLLALPVIIKSIREISPKLIIPLAFATLTVQIYYLENNYRLSSNFPTTWSYQKLVEKGAKTVFYDEFESSYLFFAPKILSHFDNNLIKIIHYDDKIGSIKSSEKMKNALKKDFVNKFLKYRFDHLVLVKGSPLFYLMWSGEVFDFKNSWEELDQKNMFMIYRLKPGATLIEKSF